MTARAALGAAGRDLFQNSWRLVPVNAALGIVLVAVAASAVAVHAALAFAVLAGPLATALIHCSVTLVRTGNLALADATGCACTGGAGSSSAPPGPRSSCSRRSRFASTRERASAGRSRS
jgi:hypothetical protein